MPFHTIEDESIRAFYAEHGFKYLSGEIFDIDGDQVPVRAVGYKLSQHDETPEAERSRLRIYVADFSQTGKPTGCYLYGEDTLDQLPRST